MTASVTRAAEGFDRRAFTVDEVLRMQAAGIISEDENFELIEGEIVPVGPKYAAHERIKSILGMEASKACPSDLIVGFETSIFLDPHTFVEPDLCLYPRRLQSQDVRGGDILLAIEIAGSSLAYDRGVKARLYARHGVRELWVIDARERRTWVHKQPSENGWGEIVAVAADEPLHSGAIPGLSVRLDRI